MALIKEALEGEKNKNEVRLLIRLDGMIGLLTAVYF